MASPSWKLEFDNPDTYTTEPGLYRRFESSFLCGKDGLESNMYKDPNTGFLMMKPTTLTEELFHEDTWIKYNDLDLAEGWWETVNRNAKKIEETRNKQEFIANIGDMGVLSPPEITPTQSYNIINLLAVIGIIAVSIGLSDKDRLIPVAQTNFGNNLVRDEGFELHLHIESDPTKRYINLLMIAFDHHAFHLSSDGTLTCCYYYGDPSVTEPTIIEKISIGKLGKMVGKDLRISFIPIPGMGYSITSTEGSVTAKVNKGAAINETITGGGFVRYPQKTDGSGYKYNNDPSPIVLYTLPIDTMLGIGPNEDDDITGDHTRYQLGIARIRYGFEAKLVSPIFDVGYIPSVESSTLQYLQLEQNPTTLSGFTVTTGFTDEAGTATETIKMPTLRKRGRAVIGMSYSGGRSIYTPMITATQFNYPNVTYTRETTAVETKWEEIEFTIDDLGNFVEGSCKTVSFNEQTFKIALRGDTTWRLYHCVDTEAETPEWKIISGGIANASESEYYTDKPVVHSGFGGEKTSLNNAIGRLRTTWKLLPRNFRLSEQFQVLKATFDDKTLAETINIALFAAGEDAIPTIDFPSEFSEKLPGSKDGLKHKWVTQPGDTGSKIINTMLLKARRQNKQFQFYYDWDLDKYVVRAKPKDSTSGNTYILTPFTDEVPATRTKLVAFPSGTNFFTFPPEANYTQAHSSDGTTENSFQLTSWGFTNLSSIFDPTSLDYLGRTKIQRVLAEEISDEANLNKIARKIFDYSSTGERELMLITQGYDPNFSPINPPRCLVRGVDYEGTRIDFMDGWLRSKTVKIEAGRCGAELVMYKVSDRYENLQKTSV